MSDVLHLKTFPVDGLASVAVPYNVLDADLRVYFSAGVDECLLTAGSDYLIEPDGSARVVRLVKPLCGRLTLVAVPDPCMVLQKFGVGMLPDLNSWAARVAGRLAWLEYLAGQAYAAPVGFPVGEGFEAQMARALRFDADVPAMPLPADGCHVLTVRNGRPAWADPMALFGVNLALQDDAVIEWAVVKAGLPIACCSHAVDTSVAVDLGRARLLSAFHLNDLPPDALHCGATDIQAPEVWLCGFDDDCALLYGALPLPPDTLMRCPK